MNHNIPLMGFNPIKSPMTPSKLAGNVGVMGRNSALLPAEQNVRQSYHMAGPFFRLQGGAA